jgi:hypothetical protein
MDKKWAGMDKLSRAFHQWTNYAEHDGQKRARMNKLSRAFQHVFSHPLSAAF